MNSNNNNNNQHISNYVFFFYFNYLVNFYNSGNRKKQENVRQTISNGFSFR